jgi:predicted DNA-binding transcriptional regulator AlpA
MFPAPVRLGANRIAYRESEIQAWLATRPRAHGREGGNAEAGA